LEYSEPAVREIVRLTAGQPYLIQLLCSKLFEIAASRNARQLGFTDVAAAAEGLIADSEHFATLWQHHVETHRQRFILWLCHRLVGGRDPVTEQLLELRLDEVGVPRSERGIASDLRLLEDHEMIRMVDTEGRPTYELVVPLQGQWMERHVDHERLRRDAAVT